MKQVHCVTGITAAAGIPHDHACIDGGQRRTARNGINKGISKMNKIVHELADGELDRVCGGGCELSMIQLQSVVSQRQMVIQMIGNLFQAMRQTNSAVIKNIR